MCALPAGAAGTAGVAAVAPLAGRMAARFPAGACTVGLPNAGTAAAAGVAAGRDCAEGRLYDVVLKLPAWAAGLAGSVMGAGFAAAAC